MSSLCLHALIPVLKWRVKRRMARVRDVRELRRDFALASRRPPRGLRIRMRELDGVETEQIIAHGGVHPERRDAPVLLYLHGGAYLGCSPATHRPITSHFGRAGFHVYAPAYRLAPENPFPAAVEDALAVYRSLLSSGTPAGRLLIAGDSAGGGLALAVMLAAREEGLPLPAGAALFSPWTDLAATGASLRYNARRDAMLVDDNVSRAADLYLQGADPYDPLASPLYGKLSGLPPLLIEVGADEVLLDDARRVAERVQAAGGTVDLRIWPKVPHAFQIFATFVPESRESLRRAAAFLHHAAGERQESGAAALPAVEIADEQAISAALSFS